jgi:NADPH:quinone reductase-like Zn-dependent oxidoreductase/acyl carrier protein
MVRSLRREHPELDCGVIDREGAALLARELLYGGGEDQVSYREGKRYVARLVRAGRPGENRVVRIGERGRLETLHSEKVARRAPQSGEIEIAVEYAGMNFRDVLQAMGLYPGAATELGAECAGRVVRSAAPEFREGDRVAALGAGMMAGHVTVPAGWAAHVPENVELSAAGTAAVAYITARYALAGVKAGDKVLVHAAAGGVGLATVREARRKGAEVWGTASTEEKRALVLREGARGVYSSRRADFAASLLEATGGRGVDVVVNSLSGEMIPESLKALAEDGRFMELGKRGIRPELDGRCRVLDWSEEAAETIGGWLREVMADLGAGVIAPLPYETWPSAEAETAFRRMAQGQHTGKLALEMGQGSLKIGRDGAYVVTGGSGGLGMAVGEWLAERGAGRVVLMSRREAEGRTRAGMVKVRGDVRECGDVERAIAAAEAGGLVLRGIVHAAGVLEDGVMEQQTAERYAQVLGPKVKGAWNLHRATEKRKLDFFVMFGSIAAVTGSPGQTGYAAANEFLGALAGYRKRLGLVASTIDWGPWQATGMAAKLSGKYTDRVFPGIRGFVDSERARLFEWVFGQRPARVALVKARWQEARAIAGDSRFLDALGSKKPAVPRTSSSPRQDLTEFLVEQVRRMIGLEESEAVDLNRPLFELGLDSLGAIELRNILSVRAGRPLPSTVLFDNPTVASLKELLEPQAGPVVDELAGISDDEAEALLREELAVEKGGRA